MFKVIFKAKEKKYEIRFEKGEDFVILLDKFLKKNKIDKREINHFKVRQEGEKSFISKRIVLTIIKAIGLIKKYRQNLV
ncbi:MAG: hypothetical protein ACP5OX_02345 [Minisyncoccia bacterium]